MNNLSGYPGGKGGSGVMQTIINQMPPHKVYIEPFLGISPIMQHKRPAIESIGIEIDPTTMRRWEFYCHDRPDITLIQTSGIGWLFRNNYNEF